MDLSVVIALRDEEMALPALLDRTLRVLDGLELVAEIVLVDDGSVDASWNIVRQAAKDDPRVRGLRLSRNFGHQIALSAGLAVSQGGAVVTMDGDLQHPPELIPRLVAKGAEGFDVVYAVRTETDNEGWFKRWSARAFYRLLNRSTSLDLAVGAGDFRYMSRRIVDVLVSMPERHRFLRGMTRWSGFAQASIAYDRDPRTGGTSKYRLREMLRFGTDAIISFSALPLRVASAVGIFTATLGGVYFLYTLVIRLFTDRAVPGWTSVIVAVLVLGGVQLVCVGIIGQYLGRMYEEDKHRPLFLVWEDTRSATMASMAARSPHPARRTVSNLEDQGECDS